MAFIVPPSLPHPRAGRFSPSGPWQPMVPGYSCANCNTLVLRNRHGKLVHAWRKGTFCDPRHLDFRRARVYRGEDGA